MLILNSETYLWCVYMTAAVVLPYNCLFILCVSKYPSFSEDLPDAFYLREAGSGRQGSPESTQAERHGRSHFTKGSLPFYWAGFIKTASF